MKLLLNTSDKRKIAVVMLLVWMFTLASGIANACLLEMPATHAHAAATVSEGEYMSAAIDRDTEIVVDDGDESPTAKVSCLKVCDESSNAVATQLSRAQTDTATAPLVKLLWRVVAVDHTALFQTGDPGPAIPELLLRVRYSRLAL